MTPAPDFRALCAELLEVIEGEYEGTGLCYELRDRAAAALLAIADDRDGQTCTKCGAGYYTETSIHDDWDGLLHCSNKKCNHEVKRYKSEDEPKPESMGNTALSPEAQTVLDAANMVFSQAGTTAQGIAAAICAAADQAAPELPHSALDDPEILKGIWNERRTARAELLAIATELEGHQ